MTTVSAFAPAPGAMPARGFAGFGAMLHRLGARRGGTRARCLAVARITRGLQSCTACRSAEPCLSRADIPAVARGASRAG